MRLEPHTPKPDLTAQGGGNPVPDLEAVFLDINMTTTLESEKEKLKRRESLRRSKWPERFKNCEWCGKEFYQRDLKRGQRYCCASCANKHKGEIRYQEVKDYIADLGRQGALRRDIQKNEGFSWGCVDRAFIEFGLERVLDKERSKAKKEKLADIENKREKDRKHIADCLRLVRKGVPLEDASLQLGGNGKGIHNKIRKHCRCYRRISKERRKKSEWNRINKCARRKSRKYHMESEFRDKLAEQLRGNIEVPIGIGLKRCDVVAVIQGVKYAIECKHVSTSSELDKAIGQSLVSAFALNAYPAVAFPSDIYIDDYVFTVCQRFGIKVFRDEAQLSLNFSVDDSIRQKYKKSTKRKHKLKEWWGEGMEEKWKSIKHTNPTIKQMLVMGFEEKHIASCLGVKLSDIRKANI